LARQIVALEAQGSNPCSHPKNPAAIAAGFFVAQAEECLTGETLYFIYKRDRLSQSLTVI
ncbi:MAG: hypothetical protein IJO13_02570, partial [Lachnospiraceae bacterium]|nr:hypothetical protein [Lachnospiraceae bacterium]